MTRRTFNDWKNLVEKQITSGLSVPQFCNQHNLNPKYFYARKSKVVQSTDDSGFIQAQVITQQTTRLKSKLQQNITFVNAAGKLTLPSSISAQFIAELLNGLAS